jgi:site-specific recombinase XerD
LLNELLLGYVLVQATSEFNQLWPSRQAFIASVTTLFAGGFADGFVGDWAGNQLGGAIVPVLPGQPGSSLAAVDLQEQALGQDLLAQNLPIQDIPAPFVQQILRQASKSHLQDYALAYILFGAGLTVTEALGLQRHQQVSSAQQHLLIVTTGGPQRQVPLNQWVAGRRYGSYTNNPLIKWLRSRKDQSPAMFINDAGQPLQLEELQQRWQLWTAGLSNPSQGNQPLQVYQTRQTWCVEMLMRGISLDNLSLLTGLTPIQLQPYVQRAREKAALEQATQLDRKVSSGG